MRFYPLVAFIAVLALHSQGWTQTGRFDHQMPARAVGMAGTGRSFAAASNALFLNPAALGVARQYVFGAGYNFARAKDADGKSRNSNVLSLEWTDSTPNTLHMAMGLSYVYLMGPERNTSNVHMAAAYNLQTDYLGIHMGIGGHWAQDGLENDQGKLDNLWSGDAGLAINFQNQFMVGVAGYNLVQAPRKDMPMGLGAGLSYWTGSFVAAADLTAMFDTTTRSGKEADVLMTYGLGLQYMITNDVFLRGGVRYDDQQDTPAGQPSTWTAAGGVTIVALQRFAIEVGYQQNVSAPEDLMVGVALEIYNPLGR